MTINVHIELYTSYTLWSASIRLDIKMNQSEKKSVNQMEILKVGWPTEKVNQVSRASFARFEKWLLKLDHVIRKTRVTTHTPNCKMWLHLSTRTERTVDNWQTASYIFLIVVQYKCIIAYKLIGLCEHVNLKKNLESKAFMLFSCANVHSIS